MLPANAEPAAAETPAAAEAPAPAAEAPAAEAPVTPEVDPDAGLGLPEAGAVLGPPNLGVNWESDTPSPRLRSRLLRS